MGTAPGFFDVVDCLRRWSDLGDQLEAYGSVDAATLMYAAEAMNLASGPVGGFDADAVTREFGLAQNETPVMLLAVGRTAQGNWPQKPRRPLFEVLQIS